MVGCGLTNFGNFRRLTHYLKVKVRPWRHSNNLNSVSGNVLVLDGFNFSIQLQLAKFDGDRNK